MIQVAVICGGRSNAHPLSLSSGVAVARALDPGRYRVALIAIERTGRWRLLPTLDTIRNQDSLDTIGFRPGSGDLVTLLSDARLYNLDQSRDEGRVDVALSVLHGPYGEDGAVQGVLTMAGIPFVGSTLTPSALGIDNELCRRVLALAGIRSKRYRVVHSRDRQSPGFAELARELGPSLLVRPARQGAAIERARVHNAANLQCALATAFEREDKVLIEAFTAGRTVQCGVLGWPEPWASPVGEMTLCTGCPCDARSARHHDPRGHRVTVPAGIPAVVASRVKELALSAFAALGCRDLCRIDFCLQPDGAILFDELNTMPDLSATSVFPRLFGRADLGYQHLVETLLGFALQRGAR